MILNVVLPGGNVAKIGTFRQIENDILKFYIRMYEICWIKV